MTALSFQSRAFLKFSITGTFQLSFFRLVHFLLLIVNPCDVVYVWQSRRFYRFSHCFNCLLLHLPFLILYFQSTNLLAYWRFSFFHLFIYFCYVAYRSISSVSSFTSLFNVLLWNNFGPYVFSILSTTCSVDCSSRLFRLNILLVCVLRLPSPLIACLYFCVTFVRYFTLWSYFPQSELGHGPCSLNSDILCFTFSNVIYMLTNFSEMSPSRCSVGWSSDFCLYRTEFIMAFSRVSLLSLDGMIGLWFSFPWGTFSTFFLMSGTFEFCFTHCFLPFRFPFRSAHVRCNPCHACPFYALLGQCEILVRIFGSVSLRLLTLCNNCQIFFSLMSFLSSDFFHMAQIKLGLAD